MDWCAAGAVLESVAMTKHIDSNDIVILDGARTPVGSFLGTLKGIDATEMGAHAARAALARARVDPEEVDAVFVGNVIQSSIDAPYLARHVGLKAGVPERATALTVNRLCGSGLEAILQGARALLLGEASLVLAGGTESMSQAPFAIRGAREGWGLGQQQVDDTLWDALTDSYADCSMAEMTEDLCATRGISREEQDEFALRSHHLAATARERGRLALEIDPVEIPGRKGQVTRVEQDEHIRPETTLARLAALPARFRQGGVVTAGNASGINDAAAMVVLSRYGYARVRGLPVLGRLVAWGTAGVPPRMMGIGPVPASRMALQRAGLELSEVEVIEVNEAFAGQYLAVERELGLDRARVNVNGGGISLGHPLAATGARLTLTALYELRESGKRYGLVTMCIGGGQGIAAVVEALP
jgi:acetyl-CoA acetyltransferase family protein